MNNGLDDDEEHPHLPSTTAMKSHYRGPGAHRCSDSDCGKRVEQSNFL